MFYIGGMLYVALELLWRGRSHPSMFVLGGLCFLVIGSLNEAWPSLALPFQAILGAVLTTALELVCGSIVNLWLGLGVWDYSMLPMNFRGQICLFFFLLWIPLSGFGVLLDDMLRFWLFHEPIPVYKWL